MPCRGPPCPCGRSPSLALSERGCAVRDSPDASPLPGAGWRSPTCAVLPCDVLLSLASRPRALPGSASVSGWPSLVRRDGRLVPAGLLRRDRLRPCARARPPRRCRGLHPGDVQHRADFLGCSSSSVSPRFMTDGIASVP